MNVELNKRFISLTINWLSLTVWFKISMRKTFMSLFYKKDPK